MTPGLLISRMRFVAAAATLSSALAQTPAGVEAPAAGRRVAITIDDGPVVGAQADLSFFQRVSAGLLGALRAEKVPATIFINERQLNVHGQRDARVAAVVEWLDAGYDLGNHAYSHQSLNRVSLRDCQDDVVRGDVIMRSLLAERGRKLQWFRYPFLHSGTSAEVHQAILEFLEQRGYRIAPVTVDYADYNFAGVFTRLRRAGNEVTADKVKAAYLDQVDAGFDYAERASQEVFGYELPQILLIHCNELNSVSLRDSIDRMRKRGYSFITLEEAMKDKAYQRPDTFTGPGGSWLSRTADAQGKQIESVKPQMPKWITELPRTR